MTGRRSVRSSPNFRLASIAAVRDKLLAPLETAIYKGLDSFEIVCKHAKTCSGDIAARQWLAI